MRRSGLWVSAFRELCHPQYSIWFLAATTGCRNTTGCSVQNRGFRFFGCSFWLVYSPSRLSRSTMGCSVLSCNSYSSTCLRTFYSAVHQLGGAHKSTFLQICNHSWSCRTSILEGATFYRVSWCKFGHRDFLPLGLFPQGLRVLDAFLPSCCIKEFGENIRLCHYCTHVNIVADTAIVSIRTLPIGFSIANNLQEFLVHAVLSPDSWPRRLFQIFHFSLSKFLIVTICSTLLFYHRLQSVIIRFAFLLVTLQVKQFQYGLDFIRLSYS